jgi:hypothetical protein
MPRKSKLRAMGESTGAETGGAAFKLKVAVQVIPTMGSVTLPSAQSGSPDQPAKVEPAFAVATMVYDDPAI